jgi:hypothetical protein
VSDISVFYVNHYFLEWRQAAAKSFYFWRIEVNPLIVENPTFSAGQKSGREASTLISSTIRRDGPKQTAYKHPNLLWIP